MSDWPGQPSAVSRKVAALLAPLLYKEGVGEVPLRPLGPPLDPSLVRGEENDTTFYETALVNRLLEE